MIALASLRATSVATTGVCDLEPVAAASDCVAIVMAVTGLV